MNPTRAVGRTARSTIRRIIGRLPLVVEISKSKKAHNSIKIQRRVVLLV